MDATKWERDRTTGVVVVDDVVDVRLRIGRLVKAAVAAAHSKRGSQVIRRRAIILLL
jgi:hypothetical protein